MPTLESWVNRFPDDIIGRSERNPRRLAVTLAKWVDGLVLDMRGLRHVVSRWVWRYLPIYADEEADYQIIDASWRKRQDATVEQIIEELFLTDRHV